MLKTSLAVLVTATVCFAIAAATGLASGNRSSKTITLKVGDRIVQASNNFNCQVLSKTQVACGGKQFAGQIVVYYEPKTIRVLRVNKAGTNATVLYKVAR
jgi:hypothetical protein